MSYALITGSSGGIGLSIANTLAKRGYHLLLVARSEDKLRLHCEQFIDEHGIKAHYIALDLCKEESCKTVVAWIKNNHWSLDVVINNAGYAMWGPFLKAEEQAYQDMMYLNMNTLVNICHQIIPLLQQQPKAYILNVASTTAYQAVPFLSLYAATKSFVVMFSRGLRWELKDSNISVSCLSPGATTTGFMDRAAMHDANLQKQASKVSMLPDQVAKIAVRGMFAQHTEIIPGFINKLSVKLVGILPKKIVESIAHKLYYKN